MNASAGPVLDLLSVAHHHHRGWTPTQTAVAVGALIGGGVILAVALALARWRVKRSSRKRRPCPGCGTFLAPGERCPVCPPEGKGETKEEAESDAGQR